MRFCCIIWTSCFLCDISKQLLAGCVWQGMQGSTFPKTITLKNESQTWYNSDGLMLCFWNCRTFHTHTLVVLNNNNNYRLNPRVSCGNRQVVLFMKVGEVFWGPTWTPPDATPLFLHTHFLWLWGILGTCSRRKESGKPHIVSGCLFAVQRIQTSNNDTTTLAYSLDP